MNPVDSLVDLLDWLSGIVDRARTRRRLARLQARGMQLGAGVVLPASTWIDWSHCYLISIGDEVRLGEYCLLLAHDAQMDEYLDAGRIGRVTVHAQSYIGTRTVILPGVEIGPRTIVLPNSVVTKTLPPESVCSGSPARVVSPLDEYLQAERERIESTTAAKIPATRFRRSRRRLVVGDRIGCRLLHWTESCRTATNLREFLLHTLLLLPIAFDPNCVASLDFPTPVFGIVFQDQKGRVLGHDRVALAKPYDLIQHALT